MSDILHNATGFESIELCHQLEEHDLRKQDSIENEQKSNEEISYEMDCTSADPKVNEKQFSSTKLRSKMVEKRLTNINGTKPNNILNHNHFLY